jgi:serine/threonine protein kinase
MTAREKRDVFPEATARFFAGEIALAINSVHSIGVVHRDLKPENVLIGENGHIKLTDFGLSTNYSRLDNGRRHILDEIQQLVGHVRAGPEVGTYRYTAPEILRGGHATAASDFWSLGIIIYEMLFAVSPFSGKSAHETMLRITHHKRSLRFPRGASQAAVDLIRNLLCEADVRFRFDEIVRHRFFKGFDFEHVHMNVPPMVPVLTHPADTSHFGDVPEDGERDADVGDKPGIVQAAFLGFTYKQRPRNMTLARLGIF